MEEVGERWKKVDFLEKVEVLFRKGRVFGLITNKKEIWKMARAMSKESYKEINNYKQGKSGAKVMQKPGPAKGRGSGNKTKGGGIVKPTKGRV